MPELLVELLSEEIPASMQRRAAEDLARLLSQAFQQASLPVSGGMSFASPRRIAAAFSDVPAERPPRSEERRGPRVGAPEPAIAGFLRSLGIAAKESCEIRNIKGVDYYF